MVSSEKIREMLKKKRKVNKTKIKADENVEHKEKSKKENQGFLVCKNCKGYYELQKGESPEDFAECSCGGELEYVQNFNEHVFDELDPLAETISCPICGEKNSKNNKFCTDCGAKIEL
ncbi:zinc ribbon domain-containing protein [Methanobacterium oryzae]|uniref:zinc ribbon domain-containing protein n=1 Tax=Methanobacterium oryzae TaxID=69540 RepID=UPI003D25B1A5